MRLHGGRDQKGFVKFLDLSLLPWGQDNLVHTPANQSQGVARECVDLLTPGRGSYIPIFSPVIGFTGNADECVVVLCYSHCS
jgi:hypothetical protein